MKKLAEKKAETEARKKAEAIWAEHQAVLDRIEAERDNPTPKVTSNPPRIRSL